MKSILKTVLVSYALLAFLKVGLARADVIQWTSASGGNDHYYTFVVQRLTWDNAASAASAMTYAGHPGYLVTITSQSENDFIVRNFPSAITPGSADNAWLGGFQPPGSPEPAGNWRWVTGESFLYTNWCCGEPNNEYGGGLDPGIPFGVSEERLTFAAGDPTSWNDVPALATTRGYLAEFGAAVVPEPSAFTLLAIGVLGLLASTMRGRKHS